MIDQHWTENQELLDRYVLDRIPEHKKEKLNTHVSSCGECRKRIQNMNSLLLVVRENARQELANDLTIKLIIAKQNLKETKKVVGSSKKSSIIIAICVTLFTVILINQIFDFTPMAIIADGQDGKYSGTTSKVTTDQQINQSNYTKEVVASGIPDQRDSTAFIKNEIEAKSSSKVKRDTLSNEDMNSYRNLKKVSINDIVNQSKNNKLSNEKLVETRVKLSFIEQVTSSVQYPDEIKAKFIREPSGGIKQIILFSNDLKSDRYKTKVYIYKESHIIRFDKNIAYSNTKSNPYTFYKM